MIILGVDPGTLFTGYAVIDSSSGRLKVLDCNVIKNPSTNSLPFRLKLIYDTLVKVINKFKPDEFAIETAYYGKNVQSTLKLGHARGVSILAAVNKQIPTTEYSPREVKKSVVGVGSASKEQVKYMVCQILGIKSSKAVFDLYDALAVALCHHNRLLNYQTKSRKWEDYIKRNPKKVKFNSL
jgi:crossover junction endodeoxyribonuclease RuvC